jgi:hypothetical protein
MSERRARGYWSFEECRWVVDAEQRSAAADQVTSESVVPPAAESTVPEQRPAVDGSPATAPRT